ncbi:hypothetical protein SAMN05519103_00335 [Rhizobiales bacterium GAS113]|nr:hypothetical protein SAMN05519103_00335 [Rhizobiales bacterium GAS113]
MSAVEIIARAASYDQLCEILIARRKQLGLSQMAVDHIAGLQDGYTAKIEVFHKKMGRLSLTLLLGALGVDLALVPSAVPHRKTDVNSTDYGSIDKDHHAKIGRKGGRIAMSRKTPKQRREFARQGAKVRWRKWREAKAFQDEKDRRKLKRLAGLKPSEGGA